MKSIYNKHKGKIFHRRGIKMTVCGYTDYHLILGTNTKNIMFFSEFKEDYFLDTEYKFYMYLDESEIL